MFKKSVKTESFIGKNTQFKGEIKTEGALRIDGVIDGNIDAVWVVIGEEGHCKGRITANGIVVYGKLEGNLRANEIIEIKRTGQIYGDILTPKLTVEEGGRLIGKSSVPNELLDYQPATPQQEAGQTQNETTIEA